MFASARTALHLPRCEAHESSGSSIGFRTHARLHAEQTPFQSIEIYDSTDWGKLMVIDGCMMLTTRDNFFYHEMISHPALFTHPRAKRVVIIGGGDCGTLREVLRHEAVESAVQVEIDERVTRLAEQYFPELCEANSDPRAQLIFDDGIKYMAECEAESVDVVIVDSTDPVGPAEGLFNAAFYSSCYKALSRVIRPAGGVRRSRARAPTFPISVSAVHRPSSSLRATTTRRSTRQLCACPSSCVRRSGNRDFEQMSGRH